MVHTAAEWPRYFAETNFQPATSSGVLSSACSDMPLLRRERAQPGLERCGPAGSPPGRLPQRRQRYEESTGDMHSRPALEVPPPVLVS